MKKTILEQIAEFFSKKSDYSHLTPPIIVNLLALVNNSFRWRFVSKSKKDNKNEQMSDGEEFRLSLDTDTVRTSVEVKGEKMLKSVKPFLSELTKVLPDMVRPRKEKSEGKEEAPPEKEEQDNLDI
ncbi:MAG: hypothetical protein Q4A21_00010 [bacterium]|nr:hypothetical protein [bacterium]